MPRASDRLRVCGGAVLAVALLAFVLSLAPAAEAAVITSWTNVQPTGTVTANVPIIVSGSGAGDGFLMSASTAKLAIDGVFLPRAAFVASGTATTVYFYYVPQPNLTDGLHTFRVEMSDTAGKVSSYQWTATVAAPPSATWVAPVAGARCTTGRPTIIMSLSDNTPGTTFSVTGQVRSGTANGPVVARFGRTGLPAGENSFVPDAEVPPGTYYLAATIVDGGGNALALNGAAARPFVAATAPSMTVLTSCANCHPGLQAAHPTPATVSCTLCHVGYDGAHSQGTPDCEDCHWEGWHTDGAGTTVAVTSPCTACHTTQRPEVAQHTAVSTAGAHLSSCEGCHTESLLSRHGVTPAGSVYANQCDLCHASSNPQVKAAIASGNASCSACHDRTASHGNLNAIHQAAVTQGFVQALSAHMGGGAHGETMSCGNCHSTTNLLNVHGSSWNNCSQCHAAGGPRSTFSAWNKGCQQGACHTTLHDNAVSDAAHQAAAVYGTGDCSKCHAGQGSRINYNAPLECTIVCHTSKVASRGDTTGPVTSVANAQPYFANPAQVRLTAADAGSGVSGTYYRVNGGAWTFNAGAATTASVPAGGAGLLEYYSVDWIGNAEAVRSYTVTFDVAAPVTVNDGASHPAEYPWRLSATDAGSGVATTYFRVDGGGWQVYGYFENIDGIRTDGGGGPHTLSYYSVDKVGNAEATVTVDFVIPDTTAPTSYLSTTAGTSAYIEAVDYYSDNPCGIKEIRYRLDGGAWVVASFPRERPFFAMPRRADIVVPADGVYALEYYAVDWADNAEAPRTTTLTIDHVSPTIAVNAADTYAGYANIDVTAADALSGVASVTYQIDSYSPVTTSGSTARIALYPPLTGTRTYVVSAWATDRAGNTSAVFGPKTIVVSPPPDSTAPTTYFRQSVYPRTLVTEGSRFASDTGMVQFRFNAQDYGSGIGSLKYSVDGGPWVSQAGHPQLTYLDVYVDLGWGSHTVSYYATDGAGNVEGTKTVTFVVEPAPLTFCFEMTNLLYNGDITWDSANYLYDVAVYRSGELVCSYSGQTWDEANAPLAYKYFTFPGAGAGPYRVEMVLHTQNSGDQTLVWEDVNGYANEWIYLGESYYDVVPGIEVETVAPVTYPSESDGDTIESDTGEYSVDLMGVDEDSGVAATYFMLDDGDWQLGAQPISSVGLEGYGTHTLAYYSVDRAGNTEATQTLSLTIVAPPEVRFQMTNIGNTNPLVTDATWLSAPYWYDIEVFSADRQTLWDKSANTWDVDEYGASIEPKLSLSLSLTGQRFGPFTAVATVHLPDGTSQAFTSEPFELAAGESIDIAGTFSDDLAWFDPTAP